MTKKGRTMRCDVCGVERFICGDCLQTGFLYCYDTAASRKRITRRRAH